MGDLLEAQRGQLVPVREVGADQRCNLLGWPRCAEVCVVAVPAGRAEAAAEAGAAGVLGWLFSNLHLFVFDPLFLRRGKLKRLLNLR